MLGFASTLAINRRAAFSSLVFMAFTPVNRGDIAPRVLAAASIKDLGGPVIQNLKTHFLAFPRVRHRNTRRKLCNAGCRLQGPSDHVPRGVGLLAHYGCAVRHKVRRSTQRGWPFNASHNGRATARRHDVPLEGRCAYAFAGKAMFFKEQ